MELDLSLVRNPRQQAGWSAHPIECKKKHDHLPGMVMFSARSSSFAVGKVVAHRAHNGQERTYL
jgi:hypothetical protein